MSHGRVVPLFGATALVGLCAGVWLGVLAAGHDLLPRAVAVWLPFQMVRPLHVVCVVAWIVLAAYTRVYWTLVALSSGEAWWSRLPRWHWVLVVLTGTGVVGAIGMGIFGGREYLEFPPLLAVPLFLGATLFAVSLFGAIRTTWRAWPVFYWMWGTGALLFLATLAEAYVWLLPAVGHNVLADTTVQWKAYGALVGSMNMLVYGAALATMYRLVRDDTMVWGRAPFLLYLVALANLLFGWGHHTYIVPMPAWIRYVAYAVSMTELAVLWHLLRHFRNALRRHRQVAHPVARRLFASAQYWTAGNMGLAILISVPAINAWTHGTQVTVAHAMGSMIGISTTLLLAVLYDMTDTMVRSPPRWMMRLSLVAVKLFNVALALFLGGLLGLGAVRGRWLYLQVPATFHDMTMRAALPSEVLLGAGLVLAASLTCLALPPLHACVTALAARRMPAVCRAATLT